MSQSETAPARALWVVLASALLAALTLAAALHATRAPDEPVNQAGDRLTGTPERAAESFIEAYRSGAFQRAAYFASGALADDLRARAQREPAAATPAARDAFVVHESHRMAQQRLRLLGVLVHDGQAEDAGTPVSLTLHKQNGRYLVEEIAW
jgi:hypothetical protein